MPGIEKYSFFDSTIDDERNYSAQEFADFFKSVLGTGILNGGENLQVGCENNSMNVFIKAGEAWIEGYKYSLGSGNLNLTIDAADPTQDRIDRIIIRLDKTLENRYIKAFVLKGTPGATPVPSDLTRNENIYEISLAQVRIIAGKSFIEASSISDERLNTNVCGLANSLIQADTSEIFRQFQDFLNEKKIEYPAQWKAWFDLTCATQENVLKTYNENLGEWLNTLKGRLSEADVTYLDSQIQENKQQCDVLFQSVSKGKAQIASALTDVGKPTQSDATFQQITDNIKTIDLRQDNFNERYSTYEMVMMYGFNPGIIMNGGSI
ncbi:MAG: hypothetical protein N4A48_04160 [Tepidibacter sp.]|jgi:hypothetical protein|uniref:hypothetical protein n=1 Tax=Tepidibacter sp. TaxID=2529387 RepID=UPI0025D3FB6E|nr:hypothetical protein [Tepidibacter sp.]MCT4507944.1 hypothetical protein [Tepidibacter sp.]